MAAGQHAARDGRGHRSAPCLIVSTEAEAAALAGMAAGRGLAWGGVRVADAASLPGAIAECGPSGVVAACLDAIADGAALLDAVGAAARAGTQVVLLHAGVEAAAGGAIPADRVRAAVLEAQGAISAASHRDLFELAFVCAALPRLPAGPRIAILSGGGGGGVIAADLCGQAGLQVPPLSEATRARLAALVPAIASTGNPVDLTPEMFTARFYDGFGQALDVVAEDPAIDAVLLPTTFNAPRGNAVAAQVLAAFARRCPKPVLVAANPAPDMLEVFAAECTAVMPDVAHAARALAMLVRRAAWLPPAPAPATGVAGPGLDEPEALGFLRAAQAVVPAEGVAQAAWRIGFPVVLSVPGAEVADLWDEAELAAATARLAARATPGASFTLRRDLPGQLTLRILATRDAAFGPLIALGAGGVHGRILDTLAIARAPIDAGAAAALLAGHPAVAHARRMQAGLDLAPAAAALAGLSAQVAAEPAGRFDLVLDPVEILPEGLRVLDLALSRSGI